VVSPGLYRRDRRRRAPGLECGKREGSPTPSGHDAALALLRERFRGKPVVLYVSPKDGTPGN
jgi:hypothetical protein